MRVRGEPFLYSAAGQVMAAAMVCDEHAPSVLAVIR
jgi:hypothetical protein